MLVEQPIVAQKLYLEDDPLLTQDLSRGSSIILGDVLITDSI